MKVQMRSVSNKYSNCCSPDMLSLNLMIYYAIGHLILANSVVDGHLWVLLVMTLLLPWVFAVVSMG